MSLPSYPKYKSSSFEWLGDVPESWRILKLKHLASKITDGAHVSPETEGGEFYFVSTKDLGSNGIDFSGALLTSPSSYSALVASGCKPQVGDVLFSKDGSIGKTVVVRDDLDFVVSSSLIIIRPDQSQLEPQFLHYLCQGTAIRGQVESFVKGAGLPRLSLQNLLKVEALAPTIPEQLDIVAWLDTNTGKIDALLQEQQRLIELLKEKREAVISHAVTKGLNPDAPMRDSGIKWLESIPLHWRVGKLKHLARRVTDGAHVSPETDGGEFYFVSTKDLRDDEIDFSGALLTSPASYRNLMAAGCKPELGDVLFSKDGSIGKTIVVRREVEFVVASSLIIIRPDPAKSHPEFLSYLCQSRYIQSQVESFVKGAGLPRLSIQNLLKVTAIFVPLAEQVAIAEHLAFETRELDSLLRQAEKAIELLGERRNALISAAVTGKIDVREAVAEIVA
jgi:type I restriction enzyme, S subunit